MNRLTIPTIYLMDRIRHKCQGRTTFSISLRSKFILSSFILILVPFVAFGVATYKTAEKIIQKNISSIALKNVTKISVKIDHYFEDIESAASLLFSSQGMIDYFRNLPSVSPSASGSHSHYEDLAAANSSYKILSNIINLGDARFSGIYFFNDRFSYFVHPIYSYQLGDNIYKNETWYKKSLNPKNSVYLFSESWNPANQSKSKYVLSMSRPLKDITTGTSLGVLRFDMDFERFAQMIMAEDSDSYVHSNLFVLDSENMIVFFKKPHLLGNKFEYLNTESGSGVTSQVINRRTVYVVYHSSPYTNWKVINMVPADEVLTDLIFVRNTVIVLTIICIVAIMWFSSAISSVLLKPVNKLINAMSEVEKGKFSTRVHIKNRDETRFLADSFNNMASNIENLINKVYKAELKKKEAELHTLQSQINPHFLYNTLEAIRGAALAYNVHDIASMSKSLSGIFRYSISSGTLVPLKDELTHLDNYFAIQNFRHDNKFEVSYQIPDELYKHAFLKLSLQPIVENSIKHGLEMKLGRGKIEIRMLISHGIIKVEIWDDGPGMDINRIEELNSNLKHGTRLHIKNGTHNPASGMGIGVGNVNARLKLHFGDQYGLRFATAEKGTLVEMTFPAVEWEENKT